jgi:hypothetical protein
MPRLTIGWLGRKHLSRSALSLTCWCCAAMRSTGFGDDPRSDELLLAGL